LETGLETPFLYSNPMPSQQATYNRQIVLQLMRDVTAVSLPINIILQDFALSTIIEGREAVTAVIHTLLADKETASL
jgi:hypothetical protein